MLLFTCISLECNLPTFICLTTPRLYDRMDDLLEIDVAISYVADVLTVVFTGGPELCLKVREDQVEKLFEMVTSLRGMEERAQLILTLQAIAKVIDEQ